MFEDQVFFFKLALHTTFFVDDRCLDRYRQHPDSAVNTNKRLRKWRFGRSGQDARIHFLKWVDLYLKAHSITDDAVLNAARRLTLPYRRPKVALLRDLFSGPRKATNACWRSRQPPLR
jgi:hypothetical protein